jgi:hypothetical protein
VDAVNNDTNVDVPPEPIAADGTDVHVPDDANENEIEPDTSVATVNETTVTTKWRLTSMPRWTPYYTDPILGNAIFRHVSHANTVTCMSLWS